jgi:small ubiquitin-related modifier
VRGAVSEGRGAEVGSGAERRGHKGRRSRGGRGARAQSGGELVFRIKASTKIKKMKKAYADKRQIDPATVRFMFEGKRLDDDHTCSEAGLSDSDTIDATVEQTGGAL